MKNNLEDWRIICKCPESNEDFTRNLQFWNPAKTKWYYYKEAYYSLLYNQICCIWIENGRFYFRHYDVTQTREFIPIFDKFEDLKCYYKKLLNVK
jgi:hypothetical protein